MARVLVLFAHPSFHKSRVHRGLVRAVRALDGVTFHDLYEAYPDFDVDVPQEQALLEGHDVYVLQHPFYWYSTPPIVKQWLDLVLQHGWAYGERGTALQGKRMLSAITAGGGAESYGADSPTQLSVRQFLAPLEQTARLCGIEYLNPHVVHGTHSLTESEIGAAAAEYARIVVALRDEKEPG